MPLPRINTAMLAALLSSPLALTMAMAASGSSAVADVVERELLSRGEPGTFFLILFATAAIGGVGKVMLVWDDRRSYVHQVGQLLFSMFAATVVAFYGWKRFDPYTNMVMAALAAPFFDVALGWLNGRVFGVAPAPAPRGKEDVA